jgi:hypothetical protein
MSNKSSIKKTAVSLSVFIGVTISLLIIAGCGLTGKPRPRAGYLATDTFGIAFANPDNLGTHGYGFSFTEAAGIVYTCKAGHVDLDHIRGNADTTRYLVGKIRKVLSKKGKGFSFNLSGEMSKHIIKLTYPNDWDSKANKEAVIEEIAFGLAPYLAFNATTWHEIQTWFGVHYAGFEPEFNSAFAWEDVYSNLLGTRLSVEAMKNKDYDFDQAMTIAINRQLKELLVQPRSVAVHASDKMRGDWYTGNFVPDVKMRNFDIGLDGFVTPTMVLGIEECNSEPLPLPVPTLDALHKHGFSMTYEISPRVFEQWAMFKAINSNKIFPKEHYPVFLKYMKKEATKKGYKYLE